MLKDTIISVFNSDGTLLKWLKKVEDALKNASASEFRVNKKGNATISFSIVFANGDTLESGDIILQQGESVTGATIRQGHLILTLSNGNELDAGDLGAVTGFSINESQHLIVTYQNGTIQDLGAIFTGNINITGSITASTVKTSVLTSNEDKISTLKPIVEVMDGYSFVPHPNLAVNGISLTFAGVTKNGNKLTFAIAGEYDATITAPSPLYFGSFDIPISIANKLIPAFSNYLDVKLLTLARDSEVYVQKPISAYKQGTTQIGILARNMNTGFDGTNKYYFRYEVTFLFSDNLV